MSRLAQLLIVALATGMVLTGCGAPNSVNGNGVGIGSTTSSQAFVSGVPGGGGGSLDTAKSAAGSWVGTATVEQSFADLGGAKSGVVKVTPPVDNEFKLALELKTLATGVIIGTYSDDNDNGSSCQGAVNTDNKVVVQADWVDGRIIMTGDMTPTLYAGTYEVVDNNGAQVHVGTFNLSNTGDARDLGALSFIMYDSTGNQVDIVVTDPLGNEFHWYDTDTVYSEGINGDTTIGPDIVAIPKEMAHPGPWNIIIHHWAQYDPGTTPMNISLEVWIDGQLESELFSGSVPGNFPSSTNYLNTASHIANVTYQYSPSVGGGN